MPIDPALFALAVAITLFAGFVKGAIGFAMPMIMISALSSFLPPQTALAALVLPTLVTNLAQAFRDGWPAARGAMWAYRRYIAATVVCIALSAQVAGAIPQGAFLFALGLPITAFALWQLTGRPLALPVAQRNRAEWIGGAVGGLYGGVSGVWGPPLLVLMLSLHEPKATMIRVQGAVFLLGAVMLLAAHLQSGVLNGATLSLSAALTLPAMAGVWLGQRLQDRLDQARFRRWTLVLLVLTGLNLMAQTAI